MENNIKMEKIKVSNPNGEGWKGTQIEVGGKKIEGVSGITFNVAGDKYPCFIIETVCMQPEIEMEGDISFKFTPETVSDAIAVIQREFRPGSKYFEEMVASVQEKIKMLVAEYGEMSSKKFSEEIVRQILRMPRKDITTLDDCKRRYSK